MQLNSFFFRANALNALVKTILAISALVFSCCLRAEKVSVGIFKSPLGVELLTIIDKPCDPSLGNATLITAGKQVVACWIVDGDKIKVNWLDGSTSKIFDGLSMVALGDISNFSKPLPVTNQPKARKVHLTCDADGWSMEVDVERNEKGELQRFLIGGDTVIANEKSMFISFTYDGLTVALNTVSAGFTYEPAGVQNYIRRLTGGKTRGSGTCRINELVKKF
jgi:hypothetical protein